MPGIYNINNGYNNNTKKISSKLTFEVGEKFTGRIVEKGDGKDVTIKLADGWQFIAELDGNVNLDDIKLVKFQVEGFESGKLKLKLIPNTTDDSAVDDENFQEIVEKEGLSKEDIDLLKKMVKHNIPLTRDNINEIKGLIQFNEKVNSDPEEIDAFIEKYLQSKGIDSGSDNGQAIKEILTKFLNVFKNMSTEDIITFIENKLDFTEENINSFNKLFKGDESIEKLLIKISNSLNSSENIDVNVEKNNLNLEKEQILNKGIDLGKSNPETTMASKVYNSNDPANNKLNILDILKTLAGEDKKDSDGIDKNILPKDIDNQSSSLEDKLNNKEFLKVLKDSINSDNMSFKDSVKNQATSLIETSNKNKLEEVLSKIEGKDIKLTDGEFKKLNDLLNNKVQVEDIFKGNKSSDDIQSKQLFNNSKQGFMAKDAIEKNLTDQFFKDGFRNKEIIKSDIRGKIDGVRDIVKGLISQLELKDDSYEKVMNLIKNNINDFKVFNSISNEYYYLNIPVKSEFQEYPCKLIIKDNRKDGKKIDSTNAKMVVSIKTVNLGEIDGYLTMRDNKIDVNLKCDESFSSILRNNKSKLVDGLSTLGLLVNVTVSDKEKPVDLVSCREFFNDLTISTIDTMV